MDIFELLILQYVEYWQIYNYSFIVYIYTIPIFRYLW